VASCRLRASNKSLKPTPSATGAAYLSRLRVGFNVRRELEACATERSWTIFSCEAESQTCIGVPTDARNPWEQPRLVRPAYELGQNCHNVSADIGFRCLQFDHATPKKFNSRLVVPEIGDRRIDPVEFAAWCRACGADPGEAIREL
jgi:hypothetical protein